MVTFFKSFSNLLLGITTILFLWLPVEIMSMCFAVYMICKPFFSAIYHAVLSIVLGRKLLLRTPHRYPIWHSSSLPAALVGAVGGIIVVLLGSLAFIAGPRLFWRKEAAQFTARRFWLLAIAIRMFTSALAGALGSAVLLLAEVDIKDLNVLHSAYYGAVGGAYFSVCLSIISKVAKVVGRRQQTRVPNSEPRV
ncbi:hypothetical protein CPB83DRAFT_121590 [Crepidotus variabilis]|uniref:Uncharacterized protein n=1 Tax=Crepidotus variabilis TaxID=179855 RepID=A0A9P6ELG7_9AGAR|nr:hypothetical protein CPB83DRAFT_121590 [Crepidotus variabilis]